MCPNLTESDHPHKQQKYCQENDVKGGKEAKKRKDLSIRPAHVELNGNQTGEGSDGCAQAADIDTGKHVLPLICESGQHHCSRNIADNLACANSGKKCAGPQKPLEEHTDCIYASQIFGYGKETDECKKQHIVNFFEQLSVCQEKGNDSYGSGYGIGDHSENSKQAQQEQGQVKQQMALAADTGFFQLLIRQLLGQQGNGGSSQKNEAYCSEGQRYREKFPDSQVVEGIEVQILRVANRCGHAAQICCNSLKYSYGDNIALASQLIQKHQGKGNEDDQRHIICYKHRTEKRKHNQCDT